MELASFGRRRENRRVCRASWPLLGHRAFGAHPVVGAEVSFHAAAAPVIQLLFWSMEPSLYNISSVCATTSGPFEVEK